MSDAQKAAQDIYKALEKELGAQGQDNREYWIEKFRKIIDKHMC